ncbi:hypothetical protein L2E69_17895 [Planktothrix agardhii 1806]|uniref:hypothetical protein n=2 Tax=Planktothrix agardhii TaxID=1160 RepID=UPI001F1C0EAB|nr:hypothetical protein [Planktothrix agardhii]MCF3573383.1 hypothetical protein [Planktothrix agardhii 1805]MCF3584603.1 hypothetical protein [Planktothrix agardhii 1803]MCF3601286.1 hypothetical protein [Planktothrix agardhii 1804]MCF3617804.1 hypothetical protein [Planktothrix agardhii 1806]
MMKTLLPNVLLFKCFRNGTTNSYAIIGLSYVVSIFLILFTFFCVAASQSPRTSVKSVKSIQFVKSI